MSLYKYFINKYIFLNTLQMMMQCTLNLWHEEGKIPPENRKKGSFPCVSHSTNKDLNSILYYLLIYCYIIKNYQHFILTDKNFKLFLLLLTTRFRTIQWSCTAFYINNKSNIKFHNNYCNILMISFVHYQIRIIHHCQLPNFDFQTSNNNIVSHQSMRLTFRPACLSVSLSFIPMETKRLPLSYKNLICPFYKFPLKSLKNSEL